MHPPTAISQRNLCDTICLVLHQARNLELAIDANQHQALPAPRSQARKYSPTSMMPSMPINDSRLLHMHAHTAAARRAATPPDSYEADPLSHPHYLHPTPLAATMTEYSGGERSKQLARLQVQWHWRGSILNRPPFRSPYRHREPDPSAYQEGDKP